jgi:CheY-like chemotaxis protein
VEQDRWYLAGAGAELSFLKILVCSPSEIVCEMLRLALEPAGHRVVAAREPAALAAETAEAGALLVEPPRARHAIALLRDRGFAGRALLSADRSAEELVRLAREEGADGFLALSPVDDLLSRFAQAVGGRRRVLVVDDSEIAARLIAEELRGAGFDVVAAHDVETATSLILKRATRPDLILLDIHMPKVNGAQFCRFIKKNDMFRSIRVIFCSGDTRERVAKLVEECGADGYVLKGELLGKWMAENA